MMTKKLLRKEFLLKRMHLNKAEQQQEIQKMALQFATIHLPELMYVMSYVAIAAKNEIIAEPFEKAIMHQFPHGRLCYPKINVTDNSMEAVEWVAGNKWSENKWGIPEPESGNPIAPELIGLILVPLLCFDKLGYRVGYGKGFYDRFIARCRPDVMTVGLSFFEPVSSIADTDEYDVPLQYCVTPESVYLF